MHPVPKYECNTFSSPNSNGNQEPKNVPDLKKLFNNYAAAINDYSFVEINIFK